MDPKTKQWIDQASYTDMLRKVRYAPLGDSLFTGETGKYFMTVMESKKPSPEEHTAISKLIGWN